jgi:ABC-type methionine transport system ATPase subunit
MLLLADEPTGAVDTKTADHILNIFHQLNKDSGITVVIVTHDRLLSNKVNRVIAIRDGRTSSEFIRKATYLDEFNNLKGKIADYINKRHEEFAVIDKNGIVQIPKEYLEQIGMKGNNKISIQVKEKRIILIPPEDKSYLS